jgi:NAD+ diphosphatase
MNSNTLPENLQVFFPNNSPTSQDGSLVIIPVVGRDILVAHGNAELVVDKSHADILKFYCQQRFLLGQWQGVDCEVWDLSDECHAMPGYGLMDLRSMLRSVSDEAFSLASRAVQMLEWHKNHQFCGACGQPTTASLDDHALQCVACNINLYPRISPCVIVVVTDGERCLLGRQASWPEGRFSTLAGFLEAGESAEQALHREVFEEVGVHIDNIRYVGSQTWPFPGQLMLGFIADAKTTEIAVDGVEIAEAEWFHFSQLPDKLPSIQSMSGRLIDYFVKQVTAAENGCC